MGGRKRADYSKIINKPVRYISRQLFTDDEVDMEFILKRLRQGNQNQLIGKLNDMNQQLSALAKMPPYAGINFIRKGIGYDSYINEYAREQHIDVNVFLQILDRLQESSRGCDGYEEWLKLYDAPETKKAYDKSDNNAVICTMHSSKGLEFDRVIIIDANEGITPYNKAVTAQDIEEERRLFYVAMTRAKKQLIICCTKERYNKPLLPSRFLKEF
jgi:DNA helicase-2/ATP-dependent DNA helicase PcrA